MLLVVSMLTSRVVSDMSTNTRSTEFLVFNLQFVNRRRTVPAYNSRPNLSVSSAVSSLFLSTANIGPTLYVGVTALMTKKEFRQAFSVESLNSIVLSFPISRGARFFQSKTFVGPVQLTNAPRYYSNPVYDCVLFVVIVILTRTR